MAAKNFILYRHKDASGVSGTGPVAEGTLYSDGTVAMRWLGEMPSWKMYDSLAVAKRVHAHEGQTEIIMDEDYKRAYEELIDALNTRVLDVIKRFLPDDSIALTIIEKRKLGSNPD